MERGRRRRGKGRGRRREKGRGRRERDEEYELPCKSTPVHVCSLIVQRYSEFSGLLLEALQKQFGGGISKGEEKVSSPIQEGCRTRAALSGKVRCSFCQPAFKGTPTHPM